MRKERREGKETLKLIVSRKLSHSAYPYWPPLCSGTVSSPSHSPGWCPSVPRKHSVIFRVSPEDFQGSWASPFHHFSATCELESHYFRWIVFRKEPKSEVFPSGGRAPTANCPHRAGHWKCYGDSGDSNHWPENGTPGGISLSRASRETPCWGTVLQGSLKPWGS